MQIHPLVTVKKAAHALGVDREVIRNMIDIGAVRGERRFVKNKEKWFLYQEEVQEYLDKKAKELSEQASRTTMEGLGEFFQPETEDDANALCDGSGNNETTLASDATTKEIAELNASEPVFVTEVSDTAEDHPDRLYLQTTRHSLDQILHSLTIEFTQRLCEERQTIYNLQQQLDERNQVMAELPDLRQKLDEVKSLQEAKDAEIEKLKANIATLESDLSWWKKPWWNRLFAGGSKT